MSISSDGSLERPSSVPAMRINIRDFGTLLGLVLIVAVFARDRAGVPERA